MDLTNDTLEADILSAIAEARDEASLEQLRIATLGKKGSISERMKSLSALEPEERRRVGAELNELKTRIVSAIAGRKQTLIHASLERRLATERIDVTLPARPQLRGTIHPVSHVWEEVVEIWAD